MSDEPNKVPARVVEALGAQGLINALTSVLDRVTMGDGGVLTRPLISTGGAPQVVRAIVEVMKKVQEVPKLGYNKSDDYYYVRYVDLVAKLQDALALNGLVMAQREIDKVVKGKVILIKYQFDLWHESGQYILNMTSNSGSCRFEFKSGTQDDKAPGKAQTASSKGAVISLFKIPADADQDIEREIFTDPDGQLTGEGQGRGRPVGDRENRPRDPGPPANGSFANDRPRDDRPPSTRAYDPETGEIQDTSPRRDERPPDRPAPPHFSGPPPDDYGGPPPGFDDAPPFDGEPVLPPPVNPPFPSPAAVPREPDDFRRNVQSLDLSLKDARSLDDADRIWKENSDLLRGMSEPTFEYFRENFKTRWNGENPPNI